jgi:hypothetical protein
LNSYYSCFALGLKPSAGAKATSLCFASSRLTLKVVAQAECGRKECSAGSAARCDREVFKSLSVTPSLCDAGLTSGTTPVFRVRG